MLLAILQVMIAFSIEMSSGLVVITAEFDAFIKKNVSVDVAEYLHVAVLNCTSIVVNAVDMRILLITT